MGQKRIFHSISRENNMNAVRYYLALCILTAHFATISESIAPSLPRIFGGAGSFFALSGFLMFSSFEKRPDAKSFFIRRARRILPPYFLVVLLAAFGFVFISSLSPIEYFSDSGFWKYLAANLSFMNFMHPDLPGVFQSNPYIAVNGALWTMKCEIICYLSVPLMYYFINKGKYKASTLLLGVMLTFGLMYIACRVYADITLQDYSVIEKQLRVLMIFYMGALINLKLPVFMKYKWWILVVCSTLLFMEYFSLIPEISIIQWIYWIILSPLLTGAMVIVCSLVGSWGKFLARHDSISYDIYLFHWPVIQIVVCFGFIDQFGYWFSLGMTIGIVVALAYLSWNLVGKRFLK